MEARHPCKQVWGLMVSARRRKPRRCQAGASCKCSRLPSTRQAHLARTALKDTPVSMLVSSVGCGRSALACRYAVFQTCSAACSPLPVAFCRHRSPPPTFILLYSTVKHQDIKQVRVEGGKQRRAARPLPCLAARRVPRTQGLDSSTPRRLLLLVRLLHQDTSPMSNHGHRARPRQKLSLDERALASSSPSA